MQLLLLSNSTAPGRGYLEHVRDELGDFLSGVQDLAFVPYALADLDGYTAKVAQALQRFGVRVRGVHADAPVKTVADAEALFVGGGNTFRLVDRLHRLGLMAAVRNAVRSGTRYLGSSAGTNVAAPTLKTTNDMPIVEPPSFRTLGLVPFQINPHYVDVHPELHMGETRDERLRQYLEENDQPCLAMREGTWLRRHGGLLELRGASVGAKLYQLGAEPVDIDAPADLSFLL